MRPPKILVETKVVDDGVVWKIKKALYGLRTSPIAWETERDNTLKSLTWVHDEVEYRLLTVSWVTLSLDGDTHKAWRRPKC